MKIETEWPILPPINARRHVDKNFTYFFLNAVDHYRWIFLRKPAEESWNSHPFVLKTGDSRQLRRDKLKINLAKTSRFVFQYGGSYSHLVPADQLFRNSVSPPQSSLPSSQRRSRTFCVDRVDHVSVTRLSLIFSNNVGMAGRYKERCGGTVHWYPQRK